MTEASSFLQRFQFHRLLLLASLCLCVNGLNPYDLRANDAPSGSFVDSPSPYLSWKLREEGAGDVISQQASYRVVAVRSIDNSSLWDSGMVISAESLEVQWRGPTLSANTDVTWRVEVRDLSGVTSSATSRFIVSLLSEDDWLGAEWLSVENQRLANDCAYYQPNPAPLLRGEFKIPSGHLQWAHLHIVGLGWNVAYLNGQRVGDHQLDPAWTSYARRILFSSYDISALLSPTNAIGVTLGNGWWNPAPFKLFQKFDLRQILANGPPRVRLLIQGSVLSPTTNTATPFTFKSTSAASANWRCDATLSPIRMNNVYLGDVYDAGFEEQLDGWTSPGFNTLGWTPCLQADDTLIRLEGKPLTEPLPTPVLQAIPPVRVVQTLRPVDVWESSPGVYVFDFGVEFVGWVTLLPFDASGHQGKSVLLEYAERLLGPASATNRPLDGTSAYPGTLGRYCPGGSSCASNWGECAYDWPPANRTTGVQSDIYVMAGHDNETYTPTFTFRVMRFVSLEGLPGGPPTLSSILGHRVHTDNTFVSDVSSGPSFNSSIPLLNQIDALAEGAFRSNWFGIQSDCPGREKQGYGGDLLVSEEAGLMMSDAGRFFVKRLQDYADARRPNGGLPETAPFNGIETCDLGGGSGPMQWGSALLFMVDTLHKYVGNTHSASPLYGVAKAWVNFLLNSTTSADLLYNGLTAGQPAGIRFYGCSSEQSGFQGTSFLISQLSMMADFAQREKYYEDVTFFRTAGSKVSSAFSNHFVDNSSGTFGNGTAEEMLIALGFGLVPLPSIPSFTAALNATVAKDKGVWVSPFGAWLSGGMADIGLVDQLLAWLTSTAKPSYGYFLNNDIINATTMMEHWNTPEENTSHNHAWLNSVSLTLRSVFAGIRAATDAFGFDKIVVRPYVFVSSSGNDSHVHATITTARGPVSSAWTLHGSTRDFELSLTLPANVHCEVWVPVDSSSQTPPTSSCTALKPNKVESLGGRLWFLFEMSGQTECSFHSKNPRPVSIV